MYRSRSVNRPIFVLLRAFVQDQTYFGWGTSDGVFQDEEYFRCKKGCGLFVSIEKLFPVGTIPTGSPQSAQRRGGKQGPHMESSIDPHSTHSSYCYKVGDRVVLFTKKGVAVHGTVKWVGVYRNKQEISHTAVGIETVSQAHYFTQYGIFLLIGREGED